MKKITAPVREQCECGQQPVLPANCRGLETLRTSIAALATGPGCVGITRFSFQPAVVHSAWVDELMSLVKR